MKYLLDTNILLRSIEPGHPHHREAADAIDFLAKRGDTLCLVPQVYYEYWVVSTRPVAQNGRGKTPDDVLAEFVFFESHFAVLPDTQAVFDQWKQLMSTFKVTGKSSHDARLAAAALAHGISHILTFNEKDFRRYAGITAIAPGSLTVPPTP